MPFMNVVIHAVWATKDRKPVMTKAIKDALCDHIRGYAKTKNIHFVSVNGWQDHLHCLISLDSDQNIATVVGLLMSESSHWANKNLHWPEKFGWQDEYFAVSVGRDHTEIVKQYIGNQEEHHREKSFQNEYDDFIKHYQFED